jgi:acyl carrier protein
MGIDLLDVQWRIERTFRIRVRRDEWEKMFGSGTVGELYTFVLEKMGATRWPFCLGVPVFDRVRAALAAEFGVPAEEVTPSADLALLLPSRRRQAWARLRRALDLSLPALQRPVLIDRLATSLIFKGMVCLYPPVAALLLWWDPAALVSCVASGFGLGGFVLVMTYPLAVQLPPSCATVKGFITTLLRQHYGLLAGREQMWHHREVWYALQTILVEALNVRPEDVTPASHLVQDLGAD